jgi:hypothetical protein
MEELKYKLCHNDSTMVAMACEKLYLVISEKLQQSSDKDKKVDELDLVWSEFKTNSRPLTTSSCAKLLLQLTLDGHLEANKVLASLLSSASQVQCPEGLVSAVGKILFDFKSPKKYGISKYQHPFIALLRSSPERMWPYILTQLQIQLENDPDRCLEVHQSVFIFVFCDPHAHVYLSPLRTCLVQSLLDPKMVNNCGGRKSWTYSKHYKLLLHIIKWLPLEIGTAQVFQVCQIFVTKN